jgi:hypothetical protein
MGTPAAAPHVMQLVTFLVVGKHHGASAGLEIEDVSTGTHAAVRVCLQHGS